MNEYALYFFLLALAELVINFGQFAFFNVMAENMTMRLRVQVFEKMIRMKVPFYEDPLHTGGNLAARLAEDCNKINRLTASYVGLNLQNISCLVSGIVISFVWSWQLSLVALGMLPFMIAAQAIQMQFLAGFTDEMSTAYQESSSMIMEVVTGIRTVKSFAQEQEVLWLYEDKLVEPLRLITKKGMISGLMFGFSQAITFLIFGSIFLAGAAFIRDGILTNTFNEQGELTRSASEKLFVALFGIMFAGFGAGQNSQFMPDVAEGNLSAARLFKILDTPGEFGEDELEQVEYQSLTLGESSEGAIHSQSYHEPAALTS